MFCSSYAQLKINIHANQCEYTVLHIFTQVLFWAETRVIINISNHPSYKCLLIFVDEAKKIVNSKKLTPQILNVFRENFSDWSLVKKISQHLQDSKDGSKFWWLPRFPAQTNTCVNLCNTVYIHLSKQE